MAGQLGSKQLARNAGFRIAGGRSVQCDYEFSNCANKCTMRAALTFSDGHMTSPVSLSCSPAAPWGKYAPVNIVPSGAAIGGPAGGFMPLWLYNTLRGDCIGGSRSGAALRVRLRPAGDGRQRALRIWVRLCNA